MKIREATDADSPAIQRLLEHLGYPEITLDDTRQNLMNHRSPDYKVLVAEIDLLVVGFIALHSFHVMHWRKKMGRISSFCIEEGFRSKGIGRELLHAGEKWLSEQGCEKLEVTSNSKRTRAHQFYLDLGWVDDSRRFVKFVKR